MAASSQWFLGSADAGRGRCLTGPRQHAATIDERRNRVNIVERSNPLYGIGVVGHVPWPAPPWRRAADKTQDEKLRDWRVAWWRNGRASDLRSRGREFDSRPGAAT